MKNADHYISLLKLEQHIEGGYYKRSYESNLKVNPVSSNTPDTRLAGSAIYYLLKNNHFSAWHRLKSDEVWHFYDGDSAVVVYMLNHHGQLEKHLLGHPGRTPGAMFQLAIHANTWFAAELTDKSSFALLGCTVTPGFTFDDFELAKTDELTKLYPKYRDIIKQFCIN